MQYLNFNVECLLQNIYIFGYDIINKTGFLTECTEGIKELTQQVLKNIDIIHKTAKADKNGIIKMNTYVSELWLLTGNSCNDI